MTQSPFRDSLSIQCRWPLIAPIGSSSKGSTDIASGMNAVLTTVFALFLKTHCVHWHARRRHFRDYYWLLDEQADRLYAMTVAIGERIRQIGGSTLCPIGQVMRVQDLSDNDAEYVEPLDMLVELREDNQDLAARLRVVRGVLDKHEDIGTASLIETWIAETERRIWVLLEWNRDVD
jgi:starvation-inducible DNA-binding protein